MTDQVGIRLEPVVVGQTDHTTRLNASTKTGKTIPTRMYRGLKWHGTQATQDRRTTQGRIGLFENDRDRTDRYAQSLVENFQYIQVPIRT